MIGAAYRVTGRTNTSTGTVVASTNGETHSAQVIQVTAGTSANFIAAPSQFPSGYYGRGADGRYAGASSTTTGLPGNPAAAIIWEYA